MATGAAARQQPAFATGGLSLVTVTINGQQFFGANMTFFQYHQPAGLSHLLMASGSQSGGTDVNITLRNDTYALSGEYATCRFGEQTVPATRGAGERTLRCVTPPEPLFGGGGLKGFSICPQVRLPHLTRWFAQPADFP